MLTGFAVMALSLAMIQAASAGDDKNRVFIAKRWYSESYLKAQLEKDNSPLFRYAFSGSIAHAFAADGRPSNVDGYKYYSHPLSIRKGDFIRWKAADRGKSWDAEIDRLCVVETSSALGALKLGVKHAALKMNIRRDDLRKAVVAGIRSGELTSAPLDLYEGGGRPITPIPPEGAGRLLCNVYKTIKNRDVVYEVSVALTAEGFYGRGL